MIRPSRLFVLLAALAPSVLGAQTAPIVAAPATLNPGDQVSLVVWMNADLSGDFEIRPDSTLGHPLLREVKVAGVPIAEAEERLRVFLGRFATNPYLVLLPRYRVLVTGEVASPGYRTLSPVASIGEAIMLSGGPTGRGRMDQVRLVRAGQEQMLDLSSLDAPLARQPIRSGDIIHVGRRANVFRGFVIPAIQYAGSLASILSLINRL